jgi:cell division protein FtsB
MKIIRSKFFKYVAVLLIFGVWVVFFDDYNLIKQRRMNDDLKSLRIELQKIQGAIDKGKIEAGMIENDMEFIEKIGRDKYGIKRDDEDVYIFLKEGKDGKLVPFEE